jgi:DNA-binding NarL/FixJ family response regulator
LKANILLVDDFAPWRSHIRQMLQARREWTIVSEASDGQEAVAKATQLQPDIVLLDLALPTINGIEAGNIIRQRCPKSKIIFLSENIDGEIIEAAKAIGHSYVIKSKAADDLLNAIEAALCH